MAHTRYANKKSKHKTGTPDTKTQQLPAKTEPPTKRSKHDDHLSKTNKPRNVLGTTVAPFVYKTKDPGLQVHKLTQKLMQLLASKAPKSLTNAIFNKLLMNNALPNQNLLDQTAYSVKIATFNAQRNYQKAVNFINHQMSINDGADVIILTEPVNMGFTAFPTPRNDVTTISGPAVENKTCKVAIIITNLTIKHQQLILDNHEFITAVNIGKPNNQVTIAGVYIEPPLWTTDEQIQNWNHTNKDQIPLFVKHVQQLQEVFYHFQNRNIILGGDFNARHKPLDSVETWNGKTIKEQTNKYKFTILNPPKVTTSTKNNSVLDLFITSNKATPKTTTANILTDWKQTDHYPVVCRYFFNPLKPITYQKYTKYYPKQVTQAIVHTPSNGPPSPKITKIQKCLPVFIKTFNNQRIKSIITQTNQQVRQIRSNHKENTTTLKQQVKNIIKNKNKQIKSIKEELYHKMNYNKVNNNANDMWNLINTNKPPNQEVKIIHDTDSDKPVPDDQIPTYILTNLLNVTPTTNIQTQKWTIINPIPINEYQLELSMQKLNTKAAKDKHGVNANSIRQLYKLKPDTVKQAIQAILAAKPGIDTARQSKLTIIKKTNDQIDTIKTIRPITSSSTFLKLTSCIVTPIIKHYTIKTNFLDESIYGVHNARSPAELFNTILTYLEDHESHLFNTFLLIFDMHKAFDNARRSEVQTTIKKITNSDDLTNTVMNIMCDRIVEFKWKENKASGVTNKGIPQGEVMSPLIFSLLTSSVIQHFKQITPKYSKYYVGEPLAYVDDIAYVMVTDNGIHPKDLTKQVVNIYENMQQAMEKYGFKLSSHKTKFVNIKGGNINLTKNQYNLFTTDQAKFLGLKFSTRNPFADHIQTIKDYCDQTIMSTVPYNLNNQNRKVFAHAKLLSKVNYQLAFYYYQLEESQKHKLTTIYTKIANFILNTGTNLPAEAAIHLADINSPEANAFKARQKISIKKTNYTTEIEREGVYINMTREDFTHPSKWCIIHKGGKVVNQSQITPADTNTIDIYTDASIPKLNKTTPDPSKDMTCAYLIILPNSQKIKGSTKIIGQVNTDLLEAYAINLALTETLNQQISYNANHIRIFTDCQSVYTSLTTEGCKKPVILTIKDKVSNWTNGQFSTNTTYNNKKVTVFKVKSRGTIQGNLEVDEEAKRVDPNRPTVKLATPQCIVNNEINQQTKKLTLMSTYQKIKLPLKYFIPMKSNRNKYTTPIYMRTFRFINSDIYYMKQTQEQTTGYSIDSQILTQCKCDKQQQCYFRQTLTYETTSKKFSTCACNPKALRTPTHLLLDCPIIEDKIGNNCTSFREEIKKAIVNHNHQTCQAINQTINNEHSYHNVQRTNYNELITDHPLSSNMAIRFINLHTPTIQEAIKNMTQKGSPSNTTTITSLKQLAAEAAIAHHENNTKPEDQINPTNENSSYFDSTQLTNHLLNTLNIEPKDQNRTKLDQKLLVTELPDHTPKHQDPRNKDKQRFTCPICLQQFSRGYISTHRATHNRNNIQERYKEQLTHTHEVQSDSTNHEEKEKENTILYTKSRFAPVELKCVKRNFDHLK